MRHGIYKTVFALVGIVASFTYSTAVFAEDCRSEYQNLQSVNQRFVAEACGGQSGLDENAVCDAIVDELLQASIALQACFGLNEESWFFTPETPGRISCDEFKLFVLYGPPSNCLYAAWWEEKPYSLWCIGTFERAVEEMDSRPPDYITDFNLIENYCGLADIDYDEILSAVSSLPSESSDVPIADDDFIDTISSSSPDTEMEFVEAFVDVAPTEIDLSAGIEAVERALFSLDWGIPTDSETLQVQLFGGEDVTSKISVGGGGKTYGGLDTRPSFIDIVPFSATLPYDYPIEFKDFYPTGDFFQRVPISDDFFVNLSWSVEGAQLIFKRDESKVKIDIAPQSKIEFKIVDELKESGLTDKQLDELAGTDPDGGFFDYISDFFGNAEDVIITTVFGEERIQTDGSKGIVPIPVSEEGIAAFEKNTDYTFAYNSDTRITSVEVYDGSVDLVDINTGTVLATVESQYGSPIARADIAADRMISKKTAIPQSQWPAFVAKHQKGRSGVWLYVFGIAILGAAMYLAHRKKDAIMKIIKKQPTQ